MRSNPSIAVAERTRSGAWLLGLSVTCAVLALFMERYSYELCHRGFPLTVLTVAVPVVGAVSGAASILFRSSLALAIIKVIAAALNSYQVVVAVLLLTGIGIVAC